MAHPTAPFVLLNEISGSSDCAGLKDAAKCLLGSRANSYTPAGLSARLIPGSRAVVERAPSNMPDELPDIGNAAKEALIYNCIALKTTLEFCPPSSQFE